MHRIHPSPSHVVFTVFCSKRILGAQSLAFSRSHFSFQGVGGKVSSGSPLTGFIRGKFASPNGQPGFPAAVVAFFILTSDPHSGFKQVLSSAAGLGLACEESPRSPQTGSDWLNSGPRVSGPQFHLLLSLTFGPYLQYSDGFALRYQMSVIHMSLLVDSWGIT